MTVGPDSKNKGRYDDRPALNSWQFREAVAYRNANKMARMGLEPTTRGL